MEAHSHRQSNFLSDFILGSQDGIVSVLGVVLGVAISSQSLRIVLASGLAATFAESIAMAAVAYTSTLARRDQYFQHLEEEKREMAELPEEEKLEINDILKRWGFQGQALEELRNRIVANPQAMLEIMMSFELRLAPLEKEQARRSAILVGSSTLVGSLIPMAPIIPFFLLEGPIDLAIAISIIITAIALFLIGWYKAKITIGRPSRSGLQILLIGMTSALAGFAIGFLISII